MRKSQSENFNENVDLLSESLTTPLLQGKKVHQLQNVFLYVFVSHHGIWEDPHPSTHPQLTHAPTARWQSWTGAIGQSDDWELLVLPW